MSVQSIIENSECQHLLQEVIINPEGSFHYGTVFCKDCHIKLGYKKKPKPKSLVPRVRAGDCKHLNTELKPHKENTISSKNQRIHCKDCKVFLKFAVSDERLIRIEKVKNLLTEMLKRTDRLTETDVKILTELLNQPRVSKKIRESVLFKYVVYLNMENEYYKIYFDPRKRVQKKKPTKQKLEIKKKNFESA